MLRNDPIGATVETFQRLTERPADDRVLREEITSAIARAVATDEGGPAGLPALARTSLLTTALDGRVLVDVYAWIGLDDIVRAFQALTDQADFYPRGAIYPADITRTIAAIEHHALVEAAEFHGSDWRCLTRSDAREERA